MKSALLVGVMLCVAGGCSRSNDDLAFGALSPDEVTRAAARQLPLEQVKAVRLDIYSGRTGKNQRLYVRNPKVVAQLIEGLKTATFTHIANQVSSIEVMGKGEKMLINRTFSTDYPSHALSLEFDEGLRKAGANLSWSRAEAAARWKELRAEAQ